MLKKALGKLGTLPGILLVWLVLTSLVALWVWFVFVAGNPSDIISFLRGAGAPGRVRVMGTSVAESLSWSPDGKYLAAAYMMDSSVRIWDVHSGRATQSLDAFMGE